MTTFNKDDFQFDGMYLMYGGNQGEVGRTYGEIYGVDKCHPSRVNMTKEMFIARFKYGRKNWKTWVNFIVKNFTVEEWHNLATEQNLTPVDIMQGKGFTKA